MPSHLKRYQTEGHEHFLTFSCYRRLSYLLEDHARIVFEEALESLRQKHRFYLFGYVLMPEHVHLLLTEPKHRPLATTLSVLKGETSKLLKGNRPHLWQTRYYDFNVLSQQKRVEKLRYLHRKSRRARPRRPTQRLALEQLPHYLTGEQGRVEIESPWTLDRRARESTTT
jgi:putative transposase